MNARGGLYDSDAGVRRWHWNANGIVQSFFVPHLLNGRLKAKLEHEAEGMKEGSKTQGIYHGLTTPLLFDDKYNSYRESPRGVEGITILVTVDE